MGDTLYGPFVFCTSCRQQDPTPNREDHEICAACYEIVMGSPGMSRDYMELCSKHQTPHYADEHCRDCLIEYLEKTGSRLFYVQDSRQRVGNSMLWWAFDHKGYVCDIRKAHVWTKEEVLNTITRVTDLPWPCDYIESRISHHIDHQHCRRENTI